MTGIQWGEKLSNIANLVDALVFKGKHISTNDVYVSTCDRTGSNDGLLTPIKTEILWRWMGSRSLTYTLQNETGIGPSLSGSQLWSKPLTQYQSLY